MTEATGTPKEVKRRFRLLEPKNGEDVSTPVQAFVPATFYSRLVPFLII